MVVLQSGDLASQVLLAKLGNLAATQQRADFGVKNKQNIPITFTE